MSEQKTVCVIGAGALGSSAALQLARKGYKVILVEEGPDILSGASAAANILHNDGFEYFTPDKHETGLHCVDGGMLLQMMYPPNIFRTQTCQRNNRIRFFVANGSLPHISIEEFHKNAEIMRARYRRNFDHIRWNMELSDTEAAARLHGLPENFTRPFETEEYNDMANVACGNAGSGAGLNMPVYYAVIKSLIEDEPNITLMCNSKLLKTEKLEDSYNLTIQQGDRTVPIKADYSVLSAGHHNPKMIGKFSDAVAAPTGHYMLNAMTYIRLPKFSEKSYSPAQKELLLKSLNTVNFVLQSEHGCSFVGIIPPTDNKDGFAVSYFPSREGNQLRIAEYNGVDHPTEALREYDHILTHGLGFEEEERRKGNIVRQLGHLYPFLEGYISPEELSFKYGIVFTDSGLDRSQRPLQDVVDVTGNGRVLAGHSPKMTNSALAAFSITHQILLSDTGAGLAVSKEGGIGLYNFEPCALVREFQHARVEPDLGQATDYARRHGLPPGMIVTRSSGPYFNAYNRALENRAEDPAAASWASEVRPSVPQEQEKPVSTRVA